MRWFCLVFGLFIFGTSHSQENEDSFRAFNIFRLEGELDKARKVISDMEAGISKNSPEQLPRIYAEKTKYYFSKEDFDQAKVFATTAYQLGQKSVLPEMKAWGLYAQAYYYYQMDLPETAVTYAKQAATIVEKMPATPLNLAGQIYYLLYRINSHWDDFKYANIYADKCIAIGNKSKDYDLLTNAFSAKSTAMDFAYQKTKNAVYNDSIKIYLEKSLTFYEQRPKEVSQRTYAISNINLANVYINEYLQTGSQQAKLEVIKHLDNIDRLTKLADFNNELRANVLGIRSQLAVKDGRGDQAAMYLKTALSLLLQEEKRPAYYTIFNVVTALEELFKERGDYKQALYYADQKLEYERKMFNESSAQNVRSLEAKYENEKMADELKFTRETSQQRKIQNYMLSAILILLCTSLYFTIRNFRNKIQLQKRKEENLHREKLRVQAELNLENEARKRLAAEQTILKLQHEKAQKQALMHTLLLEQKNQLLQEIKDQVKGDDAKRDIHKALKQDARMEHQVERQSKEFENLNPLFFKNLKERYGDVLTSRESKLCAYIYLGLNNKDISVIFNVEPKSIRMSKYRIKKKLNLDKEESLEAELQKVLDGNNS